MLIDYKSLSSEALRGVVQEYICSNLSEVDEQFELEKWTAQIIEAVKKGELLIDYSENNESVYLRKPQDLPLD